MSEDEYYASEPEDDFDDDDNLGVFLIEEPDDLTLIMMPKIEFNLEDEIEKYYKKIKQCKNKEQVKIILREFYSHVAGVTSLMDDIQYLQDKAKEIEFNIKMMNQEIR